MTKAEVMEMVKGLMEASGDLAIALANGEYTSSYEADLYAKVEAFEKVVEVLTEGK